MLIAFCVERPSEELPTCSWKSLNLKPSALLCTNIKINHLQTEIVNTKTSLQQKLDELTFTNIQNNIFNNKQKEHSYSTRTPKPRRSSTSFPDPPQQLPRWLLRQPTLSTLLLPLLLPQVSRTSG